MKPSRESDYTLMKYIFDTSGIGYVTTKTGIQLIQGMPNVSGAHDIATEFVFTDTTGSLIEVIQHDNANKHKEKVK